MTSMSTLRVERREGGKPAQIRKRGLVPMAFVERHHQTMTIQAREADLRQAMLHSDGHGRIDVQIGDDETKRKAVVQHAEQTAPRAPPPPRRPRPARRPERRRRDEAQSRREARRAERAAQAAPARYAPRSG